MERYFCLGLMLIGCSHTPTPGEVFERTVTSYHEHLRWKRFDKASRFVPAERRKEFLVLFEPSEETLNIDDLEVKDIDWTDPGSKAKVTVNARFYKLPSVTLQKIRWVQTWERRGDDWWMVSDFKGPFFKDDPAHKEPASQASPDKASPGKASKKDEAPPAR